MGLDVEGRRGEGVAGAAFPLHDGSCSAGVHPSVIKAVRSCRAIKHLLYVACDASAATLNFIE